MLNDEIQLKLKGQPGAIDPRAVAEAIVALDKIIRHIAADEPFKLTLSGLEIGSAVVTVRSDPQRVGIVNTGLTELAEDTVIPSGWSHASVAGLVELHQVSTRRGVEEVLLKTHRALATIDECLAEHAKASIAPPPPSLASIRGTLYRYNNDRQRRSAGLRDYRTGHVIDVHFPVHLTAEVRSALDHEVEVWGEVHRDIEDLVQSITIAGIEVIPASQAAVTLDDVAGIFGPDWTDGLDSVEWVRRQRG